MRNKATASMARQANGAAVQLGEGALVDEGVILGYPPSRGEHAPAVIGPNARIRSGTVIYTGSRIGGDLETGHNAIIREGNFIGDNLRIWSNSIIDYGCTIGNNVKIHSNSYVSQFTTIEDDAFIGPGVTLANDAHPGCPEALECMEGPVVKRGAQIGANSSVLPRIVVGEYAVVGAGSVVTRDVQAGAVVCGNPARVVGRIEDLTCTTGRRERPYEHLTERCDNANTLCRPQEAV
jgi:acetyltransferase-like isoleucine patch superfamily enzyme